MEEKRMMISCFKGLAPVSMPASWLEGFDVKNSFAYVEGEARIRFPNGKAFGVRVEFNGPDVTRIVRVLTSEEIEKTQWGPFCPPWESYEVAKLFGHGPVTPLDEVSGEFRG